MFGEPRRVEIFADFWKWIFSQVQVTATIHHRPQLDKRHLLVMATCLESKLTKIHGT